MTITTQGRYTSDGLLDQVSPRRDPSDPLYNPLLVNSITDNTVGSYFTQNLTASYDFEVRDTEAEVWMSINNIWDKDPPFSAGGTGGVNGIFYDTLGRIVPHGSAAELLSPAEGKDALPRAPSSRFLRFARNCRITG